MTRSPFDDEKVRADTQPEPSSSQTGDPAGFSGWTAQGGPPLHPLMQHPTASVAAAAAVGFGMASHFAGFLLGAMQGFMEAAQKSAAVAESERQAAEGATASSDAASDSAHGHAPAPRTAAANRNEMANDHAPVAATAVDAVKVDALKVDPVASDVVTSPPSNAGKSSKGVKGRRAKGADDLKQIAGVGPKLEQVLITMGVTRFKDVAAWTAEDIAKFDAALGVSGRIVRDRWIEQAKVLAKG